MLRIAKLLLRNKANEILVLYRSASHPYFAHQPDLPGGEIEPDETPQVAVVRELIEEIGLEIPASLVKLIAEKQASSNKVYYLLEAALDITPQIKISWEHENYRWLSNQEFLDIKPAKNADQYFVFAYQTIQSTIQSAIV